VQRRIFFAAKGGKFFQLLALLGVEPRRHFDKQAGEEIAVIVEDDNLITGIEAKNIPAVVGFCASQDECVRIPILRRKLEAMHHRKLTADDADLNG
jgi:hypothetical protein